MKKIKILLICCVMILNIIAITVNAASEKVQLVGASEVEAEKENVLTLKVSNETEIGVVEGKISYDNNIKDVTITAGDTGWTVTYNQSAGIFNTYKAEGTKDGNVLEIKYKLKSGAESGKITISDIELATVDYNTINVEGEVSKTITLKKSNNDNNNDDDNNNNNNNNNNNDDNNNDNNNNPVDNNDNNKQKDNQNQEESKNTENKSYSPNTQKSLNGEQKSTEAKGNLPKAGADIIVKAVVIMLSVLAAIVLYKKNQDYKDI